MMYAVYLHPLGPISTWPHSDTIFGAICWAVRALYGTEELERWLEGFSYEPPFVCSSAFPFLKEDGGPIHLLPKPLSLVLHEPRSLDEMEAARELKRVRFISERIFRKVATGDLNTRVLISHLWDGEIVRTGECLIEREFGDRTPFAGRIVQHTSVDRLELSGARGLLYYEEQISFSSSSGLYFLIEIGEEFPLKPVLRYLSHTGIGGNRSVGKGHYRMRLTEIEPADLLGGERGGKIMLLSRCIPAPGEFHLDEGSAYRIVTQRPKLESKISTAGQPLYKGGIRSLSEGSVLRPAEMKPFYGRLVSFDGRIWHNGLALAAWMGGGSDESG